MGKYLDKIRQPEPVGKHVTIEPAHPTARPVYWESMDGTWHGPAVPESLALVGEGETATFWVVVTSQGGCRWIRSDLLRSRQAYEGHRRGKTR